MGIVLGERATTEQGTVGLTDMSEFETRIHDGGNNGNDGNDDNNGGRDDRPERHPNWRSGALAGGVVGITPGFIAVVKVDEALGKTVISVPPTKPPKYYEGASPGAEIGAFLGPIIAFAAIGAFLGRRR